MGVHLTDLSCAYIEGRECAYNYFYLEELWDQVRCQVCSIILQCITLSQHPGSTTHSPLPARPLLLARRGVRRPAHTASSRHRGSTSRVERAPTPKKPRTYGKITQWLQNGSKYTDALGLSRLASCDE